VWICNFRTTKHFTLKENKLKPADLDDFVACYHASNRHERVESERFKCFPYEDLAKRDKFNLDIFWLKDESLGDSANLPASDIIAAEIMEDLQAALEPVQRDRGGFGSEEYYGVMKRPLRMSSLERPASGRFRTFTRHNLLKRSTSQGKVTTTGK
jgi:type I restriction enzyme M protein